MELSKALVVIRFVDYNGSTWESDNIASYATPGTSWFYTLAVRDLDNNGQAEIDAGGEDGVIRHYNYDGRDRIESRVTSSYSLPW